jgi:hypothetical protein
VAAETDCVTGPDDIVSSRTDVMPTVSFVLKILDLHQCWHYEAMKYTKLLVI